MCVCLCECVCCVCVYGVCGRASVNVCMCVYVCTCVCVLVCVCVVVCVLVYVCACVCVCVLVCIFALFMSLFMTVTAAQRNCEDIRLAGTTENGIYTIDPDGAGGLQPFQVSKLIAFSLQISFTLHF